eukprot:9432495-Alexandrium_andersonii.AAC.1
MDLSAHRHFHCLPVPLRGEVARRGVLMGPRHAASLMQRIDIVIRQRETLKDARQTVLTPGGEVQSCGLSVESPLESPHVSS